MVKLLLEDSRVDPTAVNNRAIDVAVNHGYLEVVKLLIPRTDLSKVSEKVRKFAEQLEKKVTSKDDAAKKIKELMTEFHINGVFCDDQGKTTMIVGSDISVIQNI